MNILSLKCTASCSLSSGKNQPNNIIFLYNCLHTCFAICLDLSCDYGLGRAFALGTKSCFSDLRRFLSHSFKIPCPSGLKSRWILSGLNCLHVCRCTCPELEWWTNYHPRSTLQVQSREERTSKWTHQIPCLMRLLELYLHGTYNCFLYLTSTLDLGVRTDLDTIIHEVWSLDYSGQIQH